MKKILKIISLVLLIGIVGVSIFALVGCEDFKKKVDETVDEVKDAVNDLEFNVVEERGINLAIAPMNASSTDEYEAKTITATATKFDGTVATPTFTWHVEWLESPTEGAVVTDYVTVECETEDTSVATVKCYKSFAPGKILLVCSVEPEGVSATCLITYGGIPDHIDLTADFHMQSYEPGDNVRIEGRDWDDNLYSGKYIFEFDLELDNVYGKVGSEYLTDIFEVDVIGGTGGISVEEVTVVDGEASSDLKIVPIYDIYNEFFDIRIEDGNLVIAFDLMPMDYVNGDPDTNNGKYEFFNGVTGDTEYQLECGFTLEILVEYPDYGDGVESSYYISFDFSGLVSNVSLDKQELVFTK